MTIPIDARRAFLTPSAMVELVCAIRDARAGVSEPDWLEWKSTVDLRSKSWKVEIARYTIGMANREPARAATDVEGYAYIVFGVEPGSLVGVTTIDSTELDDGVAPYLGAGGPGWTPAFVEVDGVSVLVVTVSPPRPGDPIWAFQKEFTGTGAEGHSVAYREGDIFVRRGGRTERANAADLEMLQARLLDRADSAAERRRTEAAQWPLVVPTPTAEWLSSSGRYSGAKASRVLPVTNGGPGIAQNVGGQLDFTNQGGTIIRFVPTTLIAGASGDLQLDWPKPPPSYTWQGPDVGIITNWENVCGYIYFEDISGARWLTHIRISLTDGVRAHRHVSISHTEMAVRADGERLSPPESLSRDSWFTPDPQ